MGYCGAAKSLQIVPRFVPRKQQYCNRGRGAPSIQQTFNDSSTIIEHDATDK